MSLLTLFTGHHTSWERAIIISFPGNATRRLLNNLPYDADEEGYPDNILAQADGLRRRIARIDPSAIGDNTFWNEISWDVVNGEWSSED